VEFLEYERENEVVWARNFVDECSDAGCGDGRERHVPESRLLSAA